MNEGVAVTDGHGTQARARMVEELIAAGELPDQRWRAPFLAAPRHLLVPDYYQGSTHVQADQDHDAWLRAVYSDTTLVTQQDNGRPLSSGTMPSLVAMMLHALDVRDGDRVLQVATGTGYTAALLSERLGSSNVTSIDIDDQLTSVARERLALCGYTPAVVTGDGALGYAPNAPYDRTMVTFGVTRVPDAWIEQTLEGGILVAPVCSALARLTITGEKSAQGPFVGPGYFIPHRYAASAPAAAKATGPEWPDRTTELPSSTYYQNDFRFYLDLNRPGLIAVVRGDHLDLTLIAPDGSHAHVTPDGQLSQTGPRRVWEDIELLHEQWLSLGSPPRQRFGLTVTPTEQRIWLDEPDSEHRWVLAA